MYPIYKVCWKQKLHCTACGHVHTEQYTNSFFDSDSALKLAVDVLNEGCAIIYIKL